ncbi:MAG: hypothetical protein KME42_14445 [Tildeniella nuda ZEHNDER 1965/U140]|jgi:hypothetical protein|nr:hypothetical protein [Tildeniella nuda ZEHNDER 1965/U140]
MYRLLPIFIWTVCSSSIIPLAFALPLIAHQEKTGNSVGAMIHLEPDDSPYAGKSTLTWFMLTRSGGDMVSPSSCNCRVAAYNAQNQAIAQQLPLSPISLEGHQKGHQGIQTTIMFPESGAYTVVLSGQAKDKSFAPFEIKFPVIVRP